MTTSSNNDHLQGVVLTQKQEWVTPKILLMEAEETRGNNKIPNFDENFINEDGNVGGS